MFKRIGLVALIGFTVLFAGCKTWQKGGAAGGAGGAGVGAAWGATTGAGAGPGALTGLGVGTLTGALAADYYYGDEASKLANPPQEEVSQLENQLQNTKQQNKQLMTQLQKERAQQKALLEAHEKAQKKLESMQGKLSGDVKVTKEGGKVTFTILSEVLFDSGEATLKSRGKSALAEAAGVIRNNFPNANLEVRGHTDNQPIRYSDWEDNWELSGARARRVLGYLEDNEGFDSQRLSFRGFGPTRPVASNETAKGRRQNRRAEIVVLPEGRDVEMKRETASSR
jgi:flagellar motor protein MotB